jgi:hypothetical protein
MRTEIRADLFAKGMVILAVLQRTIGDWEGYLWADYAIAMATDMIETGETRLSREAQTSQVSTQERGRLRGAITRARNALTAAREAFGDKRFSEAEEEAVRAQQIIEGAFAIGEGDGQVSISLTPVLLARGFQTLIEFAYDYTRFTVAENDPASPSGLTSEGEAILQRMVETGYFVQRRPEDYSVAVVPVMWPQLPVELNPTGAGDICSGISAVYSGF